MNKRIIIWLLIGLGIRLAIMPFTAHDDFVPLHHPIGHLDLSKYDEKYNSVLPARQQGPHLPLYYYTVKPFRMLADWMSPSLAPWLDHCWSVYRGLYPPELNIGYYTISLDGKPGYDVFKNIFLLKYHYLFFEAVIVFVLMGLVSDPRKKQWVLILCMLNPIVLHSAYAHGQFDLMPTAFVMGAIHALTKRHPAIAVVLLICGGLIKIWPLFLIPLVVLTTMKYSGE